MSRVAKEIGRGFKKITREIRNFFREPVVRAAVVAVMAYFTVGAAMGAMAPATSAASTGAGSGVSGAMSSAAVTGAQASPMWLGAGGAVGNAANTLAGIESLVAGGNAAIAGAGATVSGGAASIAAGGAVTGAVQEASSVWDKIANYSGELGGKAKDWWGELETSEQLNVGKTLFDVAGAAFGPDPEEIYNAEYAAENKWRGAFYGVDDKGAGGGPGMSGDEMNDARANIDRSQGSPSSGQLFSEPEGQAPVSPAPARVAPQSTNPKNPQDLFANAQVGADDKQQQSMLFGEGQMKQNIPVPSSLTGIAPTPGVRYI